jgi:periplasmic protein TonB
MLASSHSLSRGGGAAALVVALHVVVLYAVAASLGVIKVPKLAEPLQAVLIDAPTEPTKMEPVVTKPQLSEPQLNVEETVPEVPVDIPLESEPAETAISTTPTEAMEVANLRVNRRVEPAYPAASRRAGEEGSATFRVLVDERGRPAEVTVLQSSGFDRLDQAAMDAIRRWTFAAANNGSGPVSAWTSVKVTFRLDKA